MQFENFRNILSRFATWMIAGFGALTIVACSADHTRPNETVTASVFEAAKGSEPELLAFLREMPKGGELHNHLWGTGYSEFMLTHARHEGQNYNRKTETFTHEPSGGDIVTIDALMADMETFREFREHYSVRGVVENGGSGRDAFFSVFDRLPFTAYGEDDMLGDAIRRAEAQNLQYLELITTTTTPDIRGAIDAALTEFSPQDLEAAFAAVAPVIANEAHAQAITNLISSREELARYTRSGDAKTNWLTTDDIDVNYIAYIVRIGALRDFFIDVVAAMLSVSADDRIVGMNIVAPEDHPLANQFFDDHMRIIQFLSEKMGDPPLTLHAGELTLKDINPHEILDRIRKSIDIGGAKRIGHGVSIAYEEDAYGLLKQMAEERILVEICLTSNEIILGVAHEDHPFDLYRRFDVPLSLNTDDEGINRNILTTEFVLATERYGLRYEDIVMLARNSLEYAFLDGESLFEDGNFEKVRDEFGNLGKAGWRVNRRQKRMMERNPKLAVQVKFERALLDFEEAIAKNAAPLYVDKS